MLLSEETRLGLRITGEFVAPKIAENIDSSSLLCPIVKSFMELTRYLFSVPGVKLFLSRRLTQDPLEQFFGCQRQRGGVHDNPNAEEFLRN